jgi:hypothetical protein
MARRLNIGPTRQVTALISSTALIAGLLTLACSGETATTPAGVPDGSESSATSNPGNAGLGEALALDMSAFVSLSKEVGGGYMCTENCGHSIHVRAPGELVLSDDRSTENFELVTAEYDGIRAVLARPEFLSALRDPDDCYGPSDAYSIIAVT